jgi:O-antigen/teichoic acid export membrane protein
VSPLQSLTAAISLVMLPRLSRRVVDRRLVLGASAGFTLVSVVYCGALLLLPGHAGRSLLGQNWDHARDVLPFMALGYTASCLAVPFVTVLKAKEHVRRFLVLRVVATVGDIIGMVGGGLVAAGRGAAYGVSLSRMTSSAAYVVWTPLEDDRSGTRRSHEQPSSAAAV